jgi:hypothetical protein
MKITASKQSTASRFLGLRTNHSRRRVLLEVLAPILHLPLNRPHLGLVLLVVSHLLTQGSEDQCTWQSRFGRMKFSREKRATGRHFAKQTDLDHVVLNSKRGLISLTRFPTDRRFRAPLIVWPGSDGCFRVKMWVFEAEQLMTDAGSALHSPESTEEPR